MITRLPSETLKKVIFLELLPFEKFDIESLTSQQLLQLGASKFDS